MTIEELYKKVNGNTSWYIFPQTEEDIAQFKQFTKEGYVKFVKNSSNKPMYVITMKTVIEIEGELSDKDLRIKQLQNLDLEEDQENPVELTNKLENI